MTASMSSTVESQSAELPRKPTTKTSEHRRATKPIMEKKRRARINNSLNELKVLILDALNKDPSRHSKLEKADILEMTVRHLQSVQRQQMASAISTDPSVLNKYRAGFNECATEVGRYIGRVDGVDHGLRQRILNHLNACVTSLNTAANIASNSYPNSSRSGTAFPGMIPPSNSPFVTANTPLHVQIPLPAAIAAGMFPTSGLTSTCSNSGDINNNTASPLITTTPSISIDGKPNIATPPSSASSTASSHFTFTIPIHQCSPPMRNHHLLPFHHNLNVNLNQNMSNQIPSNASSGLMFRQGSTGSWSRNSMLESPIGQSSISPCGSSIGSEQMSPSESDHDVEMVLEPPRGVRHHSSVCNASPNGDSVWRPW